MLSNVSASHRNPPNPHRSNGYLFRRELIGWSALLIGMFGPLLLSLGYSLLGLEVTMVIIAAAILAVPLAALTFHSNSLRALGVGSATFVALDLYSLEWVDGLIVAVLLPLLVVAALALHRQATFIAGFAGLGFFLATATSSVNAPIYSKGHPAPPGDSSKPTLVHLILDEHASPTTLPFDVIAMSERRQAAEFFTRNGFALYGNAYSTHDTTRESLDSMFNPEHAKLPSTVERSADGFRLKQNDYFASLASAGYSVRVRQSSYLDLCPAVQLDRINCQTYRYYSASVVDQYPFTLPERLRILVGLTHRTLEHSRSLYFYDRFLNSPSGARWQQWIKRNGRWYLQPLTAEQSLIRLAAELSAASRGEAYIVHSLLPHFPYVLDRHCHLLRLDDWLDNRMQDRSNTLASRAERYRRYFDQMLCVHKRLQSIIDVMSHNPRLSDAIVIVHGDHGSRIAIEPPFPTASYGQTDQWSDQFATLFAARSPTVRPGVHFEVVSLPTLLAEHSVAEGGPR